MIRDVLVVDFLELVVAFDERTNVLVGDSLEERLEIEHESSCVDLEAEFLFRAVEFHLERVPLIETHLRPP